MSKRNKAKRYKKLALDELTNAIKNKETIGISNQTEMKANKITIIKRKGTKEPFSPKKLDKVLIWACPNEHMRIELLRDTEIKLHKEIRIQDMYDQLIVTAVNKISMLNTEWEMVAAKLQLLSYYKETFNIKNHKTYPSLLDIMDKGVERKIYNKDSVLSYSIEELLVLNKAIKPERDLLFNYKGLVTFFDKYCLNYSKTKKLELPQIAYMRVAMALMLEEKEDRINKVISTYDAISKHEYTKATPIMLNALTPGQQLSSCVLNTLSDDSHNILDTGKNLGIYSKYKGGTALDITEMRSSGSYIEGTQGYSSGPVAFMKFYESIMKAWNQGGKRCVPDTAKINKLTFNDKLEFFFEEVNASSIKKDDYIESYNVKEQKYEPQRVNEVIKSNIPKDEQIKFITKVNELTVSMSSKVYTDSGYKLAKDVTEKDMLFIENEFYKIIIEKDNKPNNFIDFNISNNNNFVVANKTGPKTLIHNSGALAVYFSWWHLDVYDILSLKSNGGTDENRARGLMYGLKINKLFVDAILEDKEVYLFDPKDTKRLVGAVGDEFEEAYNYYVKKSSIKKKKIKARDLWEKSIKERSETGNIYLFHEENVNESTLLNRYIGSSNLCTEIVLPSRPSDLISEELITMEDGDKRILKKYSAGEIALCNLSSVNLERWFYMSEEEKWALIRTLVRGLDNTIDVANYPVKEGKNSNLMYRYLGIGVLNFTNYLALNKVVIDTQEALELSDALFDDLSYKIISVSVELAQEKGRFEKFYETEWAQVFCLSLKQIKMRLL